MRGVSTRCGLVLLDFTRGSECSIGHIRSSRRHQIATAPKRLPGGTTSASFVRGITTNPRGKWRAHTLHARTCRRPSVSCAVNYVHKFQIKKKKIEKKNRPHVNGCSRDSEPPQREPGGKRQRTSSGPERGQRALSVCLTRTDELDDSGVDIQQRRTRRTEKIYRKGGISNVNLVFLLSF